MWIVLILKKRNKTPNCCPNPISDCSNSVLHFLFPLNAQILVLKHDQEMDPEATELDAKNTAKMDDTLCGDGKLKEAAPPPSADVCACLLPKQNAWLSLDFQIAVVTPMALFHLQLSKQTVYSLRRTMFCVMPTDSIFLTEVTHPKPINPSHFLPIHSCGLKGHF